MKSFVPVFLMLGLLPSAGHTASAADRDFASVMALKPDAAHGEQLFAQCMRCHAGDGGGTVEGSVPRIAGQHYRVLARQIIDFRRGVRWDFRMEGVAKSHEALPGLQDVADVAWYVSTLERDSQRGIGQGNHLERGAAIYTGECASCHGAQGEGDDTRLIPRIAGQHAGYLARQIYDAVDGRRPALKRSHGRRFEPLVFEEVLGLTDYVSRLGWQGPAVPPAPGSAQPPPGAGQ
jgi:cytochrome c553